MVKCAILILFSLFGVLPVYPYSAAAKTPAVVYRPVSKAIPVLVPKHSYTIVSKKGVYR